MSRVVLHRFPISHFSEKGRALLDFKELDYEVRDYTLGLPQREIVKLSGQRKVPVIEHDGKVVHDSTRIAHHLDEAFPDKRRLIPLEEPLRSEVLALEERIDRTFGLSAPLVWADHVVRNDRSQMDLVAMEVHGLPRIGAHALGAGLNLARSIGLGNALVSKAYARTRKLLRELVLRLEKTEYLFGDRPTLADVAAVGITLHLEWPHSRRLSPLIPTHRARRGPGARALLRVPSHVLRALPVVTARV
jgi:glutathione S-transferase